ncbi:unnamed protein product, partial [Candidula unifasciata]
QNVNVQASIKSFVNKKQVAVAAVMPQRSSPAVHPIQKLAVTPRHSDPYPVEIIEDDDDDFETPVFSQ